MNEPKAVAHAAPVEILTQWEGPVIHEPGVLFEETRAEHLGVTAEVVAVAAWIAVTAISGVVGNSTHEAIKKKVLGVLAAWRRRFGHAKLNEVKQQLFLEMQKHRTNRKITDDELRERIDLLFDEIEV
jgi:hypothetical protein